MKKLFFIYFLVPIFLSGQVYKAGDILPYYQDINPDSLVSWTYCLQCVKTDSATFDVFGTAPIEFKIGSWSGNAHGAGTNLISISPITPSLSILFGRIDSLFCTWYYPPSTGWWNSTVAKALNFGDTIDKPNNSWSNSELLLIDRSWSQGNQKNILDFVSTSDKYIGLKYQSGTDTLYGWIRVQCPDMNNCYIKDFSVSKSYVGVRELNLDKIAVYPNPASTYLNFNLENVRAGSTIELSDMLGHTVHQQNFSRRLDISSLAPGCYFIKVMDENKIVLRSRFVKE